VDDRFPRWQRTLVRKLSFLAIPNLGGILCGIAVLSFIANYIMPTSMDRFIFDPARVLDGEWWRLISFPLTGGFQDPFWFLFYVLWLYFVTNIVESLWGPAALTVYVFIGYLSALAGSFITGYPTDIMFFTLENLTLAFGTLMPDYEINVWGIFPLKAKWLAAFTALLLCRPLFFGGPAAQINLIAGVFPYLFFFTPVLYRNVKTRIQINKNRKRFHDDMWR